MNPFRRSDTLRDLNEAVRDLQETYRKLDRRVEEIETARSRTATHRDWMLTKLIPAVGALGLLFAALDTLFHWTT